MSRFLSLLNDLIHTYPDDAYLIEIQDVLSTTGYFRSLRLTYDRALGILDDKSWKVLREKASGAFPTKSSLRGKQAFYDQLNEAFAYRYLVQQGYTDVTFIPKSGTKTSDLSFTDGVSHRLCEVKTINISDEEISRTKSGDTFDASVYQELTHELLSRKFKNILCKALKQLVNASDGLVYVVWSFDDFTLRHFAEYKKQLLLHLENYHPNLEIYIKVGLQSRKRVHHRRRA
jgi:hypothetical protein